MLINRVNLNKDNNYTISIVIIVIIGSVVFGNMYQRKLWEESNMKDEVPKVNVEDYFYEENFIREDPRERYTNTDEVLSLYENVDKDSLNYEIKEEKYFVESNFNTIESLEGLVDFQIVNDKKYGEVLYEYTFGDYQNSVSFDREFFLGLVLNVLPRDAKEVRRVFNESQGKEFIEYFSSEGIFIVSLDKSGYFEGDEFKYYFDNIVGVKFLKLIR